MHIGQFLLVVIPLSWLILRLMRNNYTVSKLLITAICVLGTGWWFSSRHVASTILGEEAYNQLYMVCVLKHPETLIAPLAQIGEVLAGNAAPESVEEFPKTGKCGPTVLSALWYELS